MRRIRDNILKDAIISETSDVGVSQDVSMAATLANVHHIHPISLPKILVPREDVSILNTIIIIQYDGIMSDNVITCDLHVKCKTSCQ